MNAKNETAFSTIVAERTERVEIRLAVSADPKATLKEAIGDKDAERVFLNCYRVGGVHYAALDANADREDAIRYLWSVAVRSSYGMSEKFSRTMLFARLLLAAFGKEVA